MGTMQPVQKFATPNPVAVESTPEVPARGLGERLAQRWARRQLDTMIEQRKAITSELRAIPERMQRITNQARLVLELADDFRSGRYRDISWVSMAIAAGCLVYAVSPADVVPDVIPGIGSLDDMIVLTVAMKLLKKDLGAYIRFKGYKESDYFG